MSLGGRFGASYKLHGNRLCSNFHAQLSDRPCGLAFTSLTSKMEPVLVKKPCSKRSFSAGTDFQMCLICQATTDERLYNLTLDGFLAFKTALAERKDEVCTRLSGLIDDQVSFLAQNLLCHKSCKSVYTHKISAQVNERQSKKPRNDKSHQEDVREYDLSKYCFICGKERDSKGKRDTCLVS